MNGPLTGAPRGRPVIQNDPDIADLARAANGLGESDEPAVLHRRTTVPMAGLVTAGLWNMAALSLAGMSVAATTAARVWGLGGQGRDDREDG